jgi:hypothetical protein
LRSHLFDRHLAFDAERAKQGTKLPTTNRGAVRFRHLRSLPSGLLFPDPAAFQQSL